MEAPLAGLQLPQMRQLAATFRNVCRAYVAQADLEFRYHPLNPTLGRQRAALLAEQTAGTKERPMGQVKWKGYHARRAEEFVMRCWLNGENEPPDDEAAQVPVRQVLTQLRAVVSRWQLGSAERRARRVEHHERGREPVAAGAAAADAAGEPQPRINTNTDGRLE